METSGKSMEAGSLRLTSSLADSPARTSAKPVSELALKDLAAAFGLSSPGLLGSFDPDGFSLRTSQASLFQEQCPEWSESWPSSGMWDAGSVYELRTLARPISASESSSLDTWRTPDSPGSGGPRNRQGSIGNGHQVTIAEQAEHWQTPATDSFRSRGGDRKDEMGLDQQARHFPTPAARDYRTPNSKSYQDRGGATKGEQLQNFVEHSLPDQLTQDGLASSPSTPTSPRRLNPRFVEWLMGFPIGWTELCETEQKDLENSATP